MTSTPREIRSLPSKIEVIVKVSENRITSLLTRTDETTNGRQQRPAGRDPIGAVTIATLRPNRLTDTFLNVPEMYNLHNEFEFRQSFVS